MLRDYALGASFWGKLDLDCPCTGEAEKNVLHGCTKNWWYKPNTTEQNHVHVLWVTLYRVHDDVIKWKHFPRNWPFVLGIHRSPVNSPHKGQWRGALMFSLMCFWINDWVNNREAGDLRRHRAHYDVDVMNFGNYTHHSRFVAMYLSSPEEYVNKSHEATKIWWYWILKNVIWPQRNKT